MRNELSQTTIAVLLNVVGLQHLSILRSLVLDNRIGHRRATHGFVRCVGRNRKRGISKRFASPPFYHLGPLNKPVLVLLCLSGPQAIGLFS
jgi:hypothetical protein